MITSGHSVTSLVKSRLLSTQVVSPLVCSRKTWKKLKIAVLGLLPTQKSEQSKEPFVFKRSYDSECYLDYGKEYICKTVLPSQERTCKGDTLEKVMAECGIDKNWNTKNKRVGGDSTEEMNDL